MGLLRFWLAASVLFAHFGPLYGVSGVPGSTAVQSFYIVSGFYMALVLDQKYKDHLWAYYFNRTLRLYPVYLVLCGIVILFSLFRQAQGDPGPGAWQRMQACWHAGAGAASWATLTLNTLIEGKDLAVFMSIHPGDFSLHLTAPAVDSANYAANYLLLPTSWSLGLEFSFYLLAPFLVKQTSALLLVMALLSTGLRVWLWEQGSCHAQCTYGFFPSEIALFLVGVGAYRLYLAAATRPFLLRTSKYALWLSIPIYLSYPNAYEGATSVIALLALGLSLPALFAWSKDRSWDRAIGELSYPLYLGHLLVGEVLSYSFKGLQGSHGVLLVLLSTTVLAVLLRHWVELPVDHWRQRLTERWLASKDVEASFVH